MLSEIKLTNFRLFKKQTVNFSAPLSVLVGSNGSGKTSVLEAIFFSCFLKSFRTSRQNEMTKIGSGGFQLSVLLSNREDLSDSIKISFSNGKKIVKMNGKSVKKYREIFETLAVFVVTETDLMTVGGPPSTRRQFMNQVSALCKENFSALARDYQKILSQRNSFLGNLSIKKKTGWEKLFEIWTFRLFTASREIDAVREEILSRLEDVANNLLSDFFCDVGKKRLSLSLSKKIEVIFQSSLHFMNTLRAN